MKFKKIITMGLASIMAVSAISIPVLADTGNDTVYTIEGANGETIVYTQSDIDSGHWNTDALGDIPPYVYEDFPMYVDKFVDDFADLHLKLIYMKSLGEGDAASVTITDKYTNKEVAAYDDISKLFYTEPLEIGKAYVLTISETINGVTNEYRKIVETFNAAADMPEYITAAETDAENSILIGNVADLRASQSFDEDGSFTVDSDMPRYTKITAAEFNDYVDNLEGNAVYKIYTSADDGKKYTGFISTYSEGEALGIYTPDVIIRKWDNYSEVVPYASLPTYTATQIKNGNKIVMEHFRDYGFSVSPSSDQQFRVYAFKVPGYAAKPTEQWYSIQSQFDDYVRIELWRATSLTATPTYKYEWTNGARTKEESDFCPDGFNVGDYMYFVVYPAYGGYVRGTIGIEPIDYFSSDDITGSTYKIFKGDSPQSILTQGVKKTSRIDDARDADAFFVPYSSSTQQYFNSYLQNDSDTEMTLEVAYYNGTMSYFRTDTAPDDVITVQSGVTGKKRFYAHTSAQAFLIVYASNITNKDYGQYTIYYK